MANEVFLLSLSPPWVLLGSPSFFFWRKDYTVHLLICPHRGKVSGYMQNCFISQNYLLSGGYLTAFCRNWFWRCHVFQFSFYFVETNLSHALQSNMGEGVKLCNYEKGGWGRGVGCDAIVWQTCFSKQNLYGTNGTNIFSPHSRSNPFREVQTRSYSTPDIQYSSHYL